MLDIYTSSCVGDVTEPGGANDQDRLQRRPADRPRGREASRTRYARSAGLRIAYELGGTMHRRRPWLVLIQGMGLDRSGWQPVLPKLRHRFRLVLVDNRGTGHSDRPAGSFTVADMAGDVVAALDAAGVGRAHVLGASLGGMVAQELAITHPERVGRLILVCTTPGWPTRRLRAPAVPGRTAAIYGTFDLNVTCRGRSMMPQYSLTRWRAVPTSRG